MADVPPPGFSRPSTGSSAGRRPRVLVNGAGASSGGARTLISELVDELERRGDRGLDWQFLVPPDLAEHLESRSLRQVRVLRAPVLPALARMAWEQVVLSRSSFAGGHDVLFNALNFAPLLRRRGSLLLAFNALYFSDFKGQGRAGLRNQLEGVLGRASARRAEVTVTPTRAMAVRVEAHIQRPAVPIAFGAGMVSRRAPKRDERFIFAHRTAWSPHKRMEDLLRAVRLLAATHPGQFVVRSGCDPRSAFARRWTESASERELLEDPLIAAHVELGWFGLEEAAEIEADAVVVPSMIESLCFPIAEALSAGVPVVASDSDFARELCEEAALYVPPRDPAALADAMRRLVDGERPPVARPEVVERISWRHHTDELVAVCRAMAAGKKDLSRVLTEVRAAR